MTCSSSNMRRTETLRAADDDFVREWVLARGESAGSNFQSKRARRASAPRVLIADDYPDSAESLAMFLSAAGCDTQIAYDGLEALVRASAWQPHACVFDLGMPKLDGCEVARNVRQCAWARDCLLIAVTGWTATEHRRAAEHAGFDLYLRKPVEPDELLRVVRKHAS